MRKISQQHSVRSLKCQKNYGQMEREQSLQHLYLQLQVQTVMTARRIYIPAIRF